MDKLVYMDGEFLKVLRGQQISEDDIFLTFECDEREYKINKSTIISIRRDKDADGKRKSKQQF
jgi:hypothetical protein